MISSDLLTALAAPFDVRQLQWKPGATAGNRAMALPFVNASAIQDRLDAVVGSHWEARYDFLEGGAVLCCLRLFLDDSWHERCDVGQCGKDEANGIKAGVSDSFKRAARAWGVGRYLCRIPRQWVAYDPQKKRFTEEPRLPDWAVPKPIASNAARTPSEPAIGAGTPARPAIVTNSAKGQAEPVIHAADLADDEDRRINADEEKQLVQLLKSTQANVDRFMKHFGIRSVGSLPARNLPEALEMLRRKAAAGSGGSAATSQAPKAPANGVATAKGTGKGGGA
jgi:hypothetical protein